MKSLLTNLKNNNKIVSIYSDTYNTDKFSCGFIANISDEFLIIKNISPCGKYDGFLLKSIEKIYRVEFEGKYEKMIERLYEIQNQKHEEIPKFSGTLLNDLLIFSNKNSFVITIELCDSNLDDIQGYVSKMDDTKVKIESLDENGENDGFSYVMIDDITHISCNTENEIKLKLLNKQ